MKHTFIYNKANRTKNESGITRSRTHLFNIVKPYSVVKRMAGFIITAIIYIPCHYDNMPDRLWNIGK